MLQKVFLLFIVLTSVAISQPSTITYQGKLMDNSGLPINQSNIQIGFAIFNSESGSDKIWPQSSSAVIKSVNVEQGLYSVLLGTGASGDEVFTPLMFLNTTPWIEVSIGGSALPRTQITSSPFSILSHGLTSSGWATPGHIGATTPGQANFTNLTVGSSANNYTLPSDRGNSNNVLITNGNGNTQWADVGNIRPAFFANNITVPGSSIELNYSLNGSKYDGTIYSENVAYIMPVNTTLSKVKIKVIEADGPYDMFFKLMKNGISIETWFFSSGIYDSISLDLNHLLLENDTIHIEIDNLSSGSAKVAVSFSYK